eukprot:5131577-Pyramimonas_sp.AAC.1
MFALPVVEGRLYMPVHVVEEALAESARACYFQSSPEQALAWRTATPWWSRPYDFQAWLASAGLGGGVGSTEKPRSLP